MIDFNNATFVKLHKVSKDSFDSDVQPLLIDGEHVVASYKGIRDGVVFTNKRIISINIQGVIGKKKDFTSMPYSKIQAYSIETSGNSFDDSELDLWFSSVGKIRFEFTPNSDVLVICKLISDFAL